MLKYILCVIMVVLFVLNILILCDVNKYIKLHKDEVVDIHKNNLFGKVIAMTILSVFIGILGIVVQII